MPLPPRTEPVWAPPHTPWLPIDDPDTDTDDLFRNLLNLHIDHHQSLRDVIPPDVAQTPPDALHSLHSSDALQVLSSSGPLHTPTPMPLRTHMDYDLRRIRARAPSPSPSHTPSPSSSPPPSLSAPRIKNELYKTEICRSFAETAGFCKYGSKCQFAHGEQELRPVRRHPRYKTKLCRNFVTTGTCPYDARCRFIHASDLAYAPPVAQRRDSFTPTNGTVGIPLPGPPIPVTAVPVAVVPVPPAPDKYADALQVFLNAPRYDLDCEPDDRLVQDPVYDHNPPPNLLADYPSHNPDHFDHPSLERFPVSRRMFANPIVQPKMPSLAPRSAVTMPPQRRLPVFRNMPHNDDQ